MFLLDTITRIMPEEGGEGPGTYLGLHLAQGGQRLQPEVEVVLLVANVEEGGDHQGGLKGDDELSGARSPRPATSCR